MSDLRFVLVDADNFGDIPDPAAAGARCQTCDYWERLDGHREPPQAGARSSESLKRSRLLSGERALARQCRELVVGNQQVGIEGERRA